jgi:tetratricopeptide (TPR) repeat protein
LAKAQRKLLAVDLRIHADESQRDALVARAIDDWKNADAGGLSTLAAWLNGKGEYQKTLDTIPLEKALHSRDLFLQHLDALGALDRWGEVKQLLSSDRFPLEPVVQQMYLARCSAQLGEKTATQNYWQRALEAAGGDLQKLFTLAEYAQKNGNAAIAEAAYNSAAVAAPKLRIAQDDRLRLAHASGDTKKMHTVLADMLRIWPDDPAIQNDEAYTRLLVWPADTEESKREAAQVAQLAEKLIEREPTSLPHRTLLALARLRQGRAQEALSVYQNVQVAANVLTPSALAVHAAVLEATGHHDDAVTEKDQIKIDNLLPEEKALIEKVTSDK